MCIYYYQYLQNTCLLYTSFNINKKSHCEIEFVDIILTKDLKLFIDPTLIETWDSKWAASAQLVMKSYFDNLFDAYRNHDGLHKIYMMEHCHEKMCIRDRL